MSLPPFHLAIPVRSLEAARQFYGELLGCPEGRSTDKWIDFNFFGHQFVCHQVAVVDKVAGTSKVDGKTVPVPHFGVVLDWPVWEKLAVKLQQKNVSFIIEPGIRFAGETGEQATFFLADPSGNVLEFKSLRHPKNLFRS